MELPKNLKLLIFDFDGTLFHLEGIDWDRVRGEVVENEENLGDAIQRLRLANDPRLALVDAAESDAVEGKYLAQPIAAALNELVQKLHVAIFTRNARQTVVRVIDNTPGVDVPFIVGREDTMRLKPHPEGLQSILVHFAVPPESAALVGDTHHDVEAARAAGATSIIVRNERLAHRPEGADHYIDALADLLRLLK